jgi:hypothetical protein
MSMPSLLRPVLSAYLVLLIAGHTIRAQDPWDKADLRTRRLPPSAFPQLPTRIRADLERRDCTIPQVWTNTKPGNIIHGHFRSRGQLDWAVLCSVKRVSTILVYWAGRADSVDRLASAQDRDFLQGVGGDSIGFSRRIAVVDAAFIRRHFEQFGGPEPPPVDHEGIDDAFVGKASVVRYWYQRKWLELTAAD